MKKKSLSSDLILKSAAGIVKERGVSSCTMRVLAKELNIAVGTLYNYYPSREELLRDLFDYSWKKTILKIDQISLRSDGPVKDVLIEALEAIERDISDRQGLGKEVISGQSGFAPVRLGIIGALCALISRHSPLGERAAEKRARWILAVVSDQLVYGETRDPASRDELLDCFFD